jgi:hypothetical protein
MISQGQVVNDLGNDDDVLVDDIDLEKAGTVKSSLLTLIPLKVYKRIIDLRPSFLSKKKISLPDKIAKLSSSLSIANKEALRNDCLQTEIAFLNDERRRKNGDAQKLLIRLQRLNETDNIEENDFKALMAFASKYEKFKSKFEFVNKYVIITL